MAQDERVLLTPGPGYNRTMEMYDALCRLRGERIDRCVLYVFRCATYFASDRDHDPELLKWWNWKTV